MASFQWPPEGGSGGGIASINGDTTSAQVITGGSGISVSTSSGTTTITNTSPGTAFSFTTISSNSNLAANSYNFVVTTSSLSLTLPAPALGSIVSVKDITGSANVYPINILQHSSESIEGVAATYQLMSIYGGITLVCDGTNWWVF